METALVNEYRRLSRDSAAHQPLAYLRLRRAIRNVVEHRDIEPGQALPSERDLSRALNLSRVTEDLRARGLNPRSEFFERGIGEVTPEESMAMNLSPGVLVARLHRVRYAKEEPLAIERSVVPASILPDPMVVHDSLYQVLETLGCRPRRALQRLRAVSLGAQQARLLHVPAGSAGLNIERRSFLDDGRVVEFTT